MLFAGQHETDLDETEYVPRDAYNTGKQEEIQRANEQRASRQLARTTQLLALPLSDPIFQVAKIDGVPIELLMQPEVVTVRTPKGIDLVRAQYSGSLGGDTPQRPLKIPGLIHR